MHLYAGELAALATSLAWSLTSTFFSLASRRVGSAVTNRTRLIFATIFLTLTHWGLLSVPFPLNATPERWLWLSISGIVGLVLGDAFLFQAFVWIGPRLSMLMLSLAPVMASVISWLVLAEKISPGQIAGVALTVGGVACVVWQGDGNRSSGRENATYKQGILFGLGAALGQALGLITSKLGLRGEFSALSGTWIRVLAAMLVMWLFTILRGQAGKTIRVVRDDPVALRLLVAGSTFGPFIGVWLSLFAVQQTKVGIASALMSLPPIFLLPISHVIFGERFAWQAVIGTLIAVAGVTVLFMA